MAHKRGDGRNPGQAAEQKDLPIEAIRRSVTGPPTSTVETPAMGGYLFMNLASVADQFIPWGFNVAGRDKQLREFWPTEPMLAGALFSVAASNAAFNWELSGPEGLREKIDDILQNSNLGAGWEPFVTTVSLDLLTQDNAAIMEIIRASDSPTAAVININHLDSARCARTGNPKIPIVYTDKNGARHALPWYSVITLEEMPSPIESMYGVQYCAVTRVLRLAQVLRDLFVYKAEKVSGRFQRAIHIVGGPAKSQIEDVMRRSQEDADNLHLTRFIMPVILASLDPERPVSHVEIPLASLPENFDFEAEMRWYIAGLALGFGRDYQDFAPLPGGNLGTSQQSEILHMKSRGKGPALFMRTLQHKFNYHGVMPRSVKFSFAEQDLEAEGDKAKMARLRAETRKTRIECGEINPVIARQIAVDAGDLDSKYLAVLAESDITPIEPRLGPEPAPVAQPPTAVTPKPKAGAARKLLSRVFPGLAPDTEMDEYEAYQEGQRAWVQGAMSRARREGALGTTAQALSQAAAELARTAEPPSVTVVMPEQPGLQAAVGALEQAAAALEAKAAQPVELHVALPAQKTEAPEINITVQPIPVHFEGILKVPETVEEIQFVKDGMGKTIGARKVTKAK